MTAASSQSLWSSYLRSRAGALELNPARADLDYNEGQSYSEPREQEVQDDAKHQSHNSNENDHTDCGEEETTTTTITITTENNNRVGPQESFCSSRQPAVPNNPRSSSVVKGTTATRWQCPSQTQLLSINAGRNALTLFERLRRHKHEPREGCCSSHGGDYDSTRSDSTHQSVCSGQEETNKSQKSRLSSFSSSTQRSSTTTRCDLCFGGGAGQRRNSKDSCGTNSSCSNLVVVGEIGNATTKLLPPSRVKETRDARKKFNSKQATKNLNPITSGLHHSVGSSSDINSNNNRTGQGSVLQTTTNPLLLPPPVETARSGPQDELYSNNRTNLSTTTTTKQLPSLIPRAVKSVHFDNRLTSSPSGAMHRLPPGGSIPVKSNIRQQQQQQQQQPLARQYPPQQPRYAPPSDPQYGYYPQHQKQYRMHGPGGSTVPPAPISGSAGHGPPGPQHQNPYGSSPSSSSALSPNQSQQQYASLLESVGTNTYTSSPDPPLSKDQQDRDSAIMTKYHSTILGFISSSSSTHKKINDFSSSSPPSGSAGQSVQDADNSPSAWRHRRAREKLLRLSKLQFAELATDVYDELQRRQQYQTALTRGIQGSVPAQLPEDSSIHMQRNQARQKLSTLPDDRFRDLASDILFEVERRYPHIPNNNNGTDSTSESKPLKAVTTTIIPNKTSMVEEGEESENDSATDSSSFLTGKYGSSLRGSSTSSNRESQQQPTTLSSLKTQNADLRKELGVLNERIAEMMNTMSETDIEHRKALKGLTNNNELLIQLKAKDTEIDELKNNLNEASTARIEDLETKLDKANRRIEELEIELDSLRVGKSDTLRIKAENEELQREIHRQQNISEQVRQEASQFLQEMQALAAAGSSPFEASDKLSQQVVQLQQENEDWRKKYSKARTQLRNLRASTTGIGLALPKIPVDRGGEFVSDDGVVRDIHLTKFQLSVDTFLIVTRQSDPNTLISKLSPVVKSVQRITSDLDSAPPGTVARPLTAQCKADITATTTSLMTAIRKFAASHGLSPIGLVDVAVADLSGSVMEVVRKVKVRLTPAQELNKYVDSSDEEDVDREAISMNSTHRSAKGTNSVSSPPPMERTYPPSSVADEDDRTARDPSQARPPPRNSRSKSSTRQIEYNDSYHDEDDGSSLPKRMNGSSGQEGNNNNPYGSSFESSSHRSAVDLLSSAETRLAKLGITTPSPDISSGQWDKRNNNNNLPQHPHADDSLHSARGEGLDNGTKSSDQDEEEEKDWSTYIASRGSDLKRSASRVTFAEKPTQIQIYEDELTDSGSVACETPTRANAAPQSSTSTPSSDIQTPSPRRTQRLQAATSSPDTVSETSRNNNANHHTRQRSWMHAFDNGSSNKSSSSDSKQTTFASSEEMPGKSSLYKKAMNSTTDLFDHHYENEVETGSSSNPKSRGREDHGAYAATSNSSEYGNGEKFQSSQESSIDYRYVDASESWRDNSETSRGNGNDETDDDFETASMLSDNKTVDDLLQFLEQETVGVVDSIQRLLTALRESSPTGVLRQLTMDIVKSVSSMVAVCQNSMSHASGTRRDLRVLKEHGQWVVHNLEDCCDRMERVHAGFKGKSDNELPDKQVRQRLAGLSFDMAKTTKELVRTVSGVANNEFS